MQKSLQLLTKEPSPSPSMEKGASLFLRGKRSDILSPGLATFKKDFSDLASEKLSESEFPFLKLQRASEEMEDAFK